MFYKKSYLHTPNRQLYKLFILKKMHTVLYIYIHVAAEKLK